MPPKIPIFIMYLFYYIFENFSINLVQNVNNIDMSKIINVILCVLAIFALCFAWICLTLKSVYAALALSALIAVCAGYLIWLALSRRQMRAQNKRAHKKSVADLAEYLRFGADNGQLFAEMLKYYRYDVLHTDKDVVTAQKDGAKTFVAVCFADDNLTKEELRRSVISAKRAECDKLVIFCSKANELQRETAHRHISTQISDAENTYKLLRESGKLPQITPYKVRKKSFAAQYAFNRRRFGWYFASCAFMLLTTAVAYFKWYSLAWATVMFALAVYSLLNKKYNAVCSSVTL